MRRSNLGQHQLGAGLQDLRAGVGGLGALVDEVIPEEGDVGGRFLEIVRGEHGGLR